MNQTSSSGSLADSSDGVSDNVSGSGSGSVSVSVSGRVIEAKSPGDQSYDGPATPSIRNTSAPYRQHSDDSGEEMEGVSEKDKDALSMPPTEQLGSTEDSNGTATDNSNRTVTTSGNSTGVLSSLRRLRLQRKRVPGGAAAKLIGKSDIEAKSGGNDGGESEADGLMTKEFQDLDEDDEDLEVKPPVDELNKIRDQAKEEFTVGLMTNRRYHSPTLPDFSDVANMSLQPNPSDGSAPRVRNWNEIFHDNVTAAVLSLLSPGGAGSNVSEPAPLGVIGDAPSPQQKGQGNKENTLNTGLDLVDLSNVTSNKSGELTPSAFPAVSAFQPPPRRDDISIASVSSFHTRTSTVGYEASASGKALLQQPLMTKKTEQRVEEIRSQMKDPNKTLSDLMESIASPENDTFTRGSMVRRKNACGALQVLTAKKVHRVQICWTIGVLQSITSVLEDSGSRKLEDVFPDPDTRREYMEARKRAVAALMNLSVPPANRLAVFHSPRLIPAIVCVINQDTDEARRGSCAVLAHLSKTKENRLLMAQVPGLLDAVTTVIEPIESLSFDESTEASQDEQPLYSVSTSDASAGAPTLTATTTSDGGTAGRKGGRESGKSGEESVGSNMASHYLQPTNSEDPVRASKRYDGEPNDSIHGARQNVFALLDHLMKEKDNAVRIVVFPKFRFLV